VNVKVYDKDGNLVASTSVTTPKGGGLVKAIATIVRIVVPFL